MIKSENTCHIIGSGDFNNTCIKKENGDIIIGNYSIKGKTKRRTRRKKKNEIN